MTLTNHQLFHLCRNVKYFRGVFMRNGLPRKPWRRESAIINLDGKNGPGTHWVAYKLNNNKVTYFNSFGDLMPPKELIKYFGKNKIISYNKRRYQSFRSTKCGFYCYKFLTNQL